jgi:hypothetical protein
MQHGGEDLGVALVGEHAEYQQHLRFRNGRRTGLADGSPLRWGQERRGQREELTLLRVEVCNEEPVQMIQGSDQFIAPVVVGGLGPPVTSGVDLGKGRVDAGVLCFRLVQTGLPVRGE